MTTFVWRIFSILFCFSFVAILVKIGRNFVVKKCNTSTISQKQSVMKFEFVTRVKSRRANKFNRLVWIFSFQITVSLWGKKLFQKFCQIEGAGSRDPEDITNFTYYNTGTLVYTKLGYFQNFLQNKYSIFNFVGLTNLWPILSKNFKNKLNISDH